MGVKASAWAWEQKDLTPNQRIVLLYLADCYNAESSLCFPGIDRISDYCCMSRSSAIRRLSELRELGLINWVSTYNKKGRSSNRYILGFQKEEHSDLWERVLGNSECQSDTHLFERQSDPVSVNGDTGVSVTGDMGVSVTGDIGTRSINQKVEPEVEKSVSEEEEGSELESFLYAFEPAPGTRAKGAVLKITPGTRNLKPGPDGRQLRSHFLAWWGLYPKKEKREETKQLFYRMGRRREFTPNELFACTERAVKAWKKEGRETRYIPLPMTFLLKKRWKDYIADGISEGKGEMFAYLTEGAEAIKRSLTKDVVEGKDISDVLDYYLEELRNEESEVPPWLAEFVGEDR